MSDLQIKFRVFEVGATELRSYEGRKSYQRQFQCFGNHKVFVHTEYAPFGDTEEALASQKRLESFQAGDYYGDLDLVQGDRAKANFYIRNIKPANTQPAQPTK